MNAMDLRRRDTDAVVARFSAFLAIRSVSAEGPAGSYAEAVAFLRGLCEQLGLETSVHEWVAGKPVLVAVWRGRDPSLGAVLLNSHYDVVPAFSEHWDTDPFSPTVRDGRIYARGTQDMKCVCMQYIESLAALQLSHGDGTRLGIANPFARTIALSFMPDEEVGGMDGAGHFVGSDVFSSLHVAVALDEGLANASDAFSVFYGERAPWWVTVRATGATGHGSRFIRGTAVERLLRFVNAAMAFRAEQEARLHAEGCSHAAPARLGNVVTVNLTMLKAGVPGAEGFGGYALNVIPQEAYAGFDIRVPPEVSMDEMQRILDGWKKTAEGDEKEGVDSVHIEYNVRTPEHHVTNINDVTAGGSPWWPVFRDAVLAGAAPSVKIDPDVFPAATDGRFFRRARVPVFGFSPIRKTPVLLHDHNEFIPVDIYQEGIRVYESVVHRLAEHK